MVLLTADEYLRLPDTEIRDELEAGVLLTSPLRSASQGRTLAHVASVLYRFVEARGLGVVLGPCGYLLATNPDTVRGPDVSFVRSERFEAAKDEQGYFRGAPDLAIEIPSSSDHPGVVHGRIADYLAAGTKLAWVIDPEWRLVTVYRTLLSPRRVSGDEALDGEDVLPGFSVKVSELFT
jgi:Uma2 family endonuclease